MGSRRNQLDVIIPNPEGTIIFPMVMGEIFGKGPGKTPQVSNIGAYFLLGYRP
jgi:hypothetical protein